MPSVELSLSISHCTIVKVPLGGAGFTIIADSPSIGHTLGSAEVIFKRYFPASFRLAIGMSKK